MFTQLLHSCNWMLICLKIMWLLITLWWMSMFVIIICSVIVSTYTFSCHTNTAAAAALNRGHIDKWTGEAEFWATVENLLCAAQKLFRCEENKQKTGRNASVAVDRAQWFDSWFVLATCQSVFGQDRKKHDLNFSVSSLCFSLPFDKSAKFQCKRLWQLCMNSKVCSLVHVLCLSCE